MKSSHLINVLELKGRLLIMAIALVVLALAASVWWVTSIEAQKRAQIASLGEHHEKVSRQVALLTEITQILQKNPTDNVSQTDRTEAIRIDLDRLAIQTSSQKTLVKTTSGLGPPAYRTSIEDKLEKLLTLTAEFTALAGAVVKGKLAAPLVGSAIADAKANLMDAYLALEGQLHHMSYANLHELQLMSQIAYSSVFGFLLILCGLAALPVASRMNDLLVRARADQSSLQQAYDEVVRTKEELDSQTSELSMALEEAKGQTALFEHASNRFQQLFGGLPVGCLTYDLGGTIQEWNQAMSDLVRVKGHFVVFQHISFVFQDYDGCPPIYEITQSVLEKGAKREFEWKHTLQDGGTLHVLYVTYPLRNIRGEILGGILAGIDITARREAQMALEMSEERLGLALNAASTGIFDWKIDEGCQYWSPKVLEILRIKDSSFSPSAHELTNRTHPDDRLILTEALTGHLLGISSEFDVEIRARCDDETYIWVQVKGEAVRGFDGEAFRMTGSIEDISDRKQVQLELAESEARFRDVTDAAGEFVFEIDCQGRMTFLTDRFTEIMGITVTDMLGQPMSKALPPKSRRAAAVLYKRLVRKQSKLAEVQLRCQHQDGTERVLSISASPHFAPTQGFCGYRGTSMDITKQKHAEEELAMANQMLHDTLESIRDSFFSINKSWQISYVNSSAAESMGADPQTLVGKALYEVISPEVFNTVSANASEAMERLKERTFETWNPVTRQWLLYRIYPRQGGASIFSQDITERKSFEAQIEAQMLEINEKNVILQLQQKNLEDANKRLEALASTDGLTGLKNHKAFQTALNELFLEAEEMQVPLSVILLDVDHFKNYNDSFGHPAGDEVLRSVASILKQQGRRGDISARYGGEEFVVVLPNTPAAEALKAAERIRLAIESHVWPAGSITASMGVSERIPGTTRQDLVARADTALYSAKRSGRNKAVAWTEAISTTLAA